MTDPNANLIPSADFIQDTRTSYDAIADAYAERFADGFAANPFDLALLTGFVALVRAATAAPVADIGSGPGYVTARLDAMGVPAFGIDLSPRMVALAGRAHPSLRFQVGSMTDLDLADESVGGVVALFSIIHVPDEHLPTAFAEFRRVLVPGGCVLLAFQSGDESDHVHLAERFGQDISLDYYWRTPDSVAALLQKAGLQIYARTVREAQDEEKRPRAYLLARKPVQ